jgi:hypothetical protein
MVKKLKFLNQPTTNIQLINLCKIYNIPLNGVLMKDQLENLQYGNYIINLQSSNSSSNGSHWVALICDRYECCYFDSFGCIPPQALHDLLRQSYPRIYFSNYIVQDMNSSNCGMYCFGLLLHLKKTKNKQLTLLKKVDSYINIFHDNTKLNDNVLAKFIHKNT